MIGRPPGSLSALGACLERSWQQKKVMAPGSEPASVRVMMEALRPLVLGQSLGGAGGGGFLYVLTREPRQQQAVLQVLNNTQVRSRSFTRMQVIVLFQSDRLQSNHI